MKRFLVFIALASLFATSTIAATANTISGAPAYLTPGKCSNEKMEWWKDHGSDHNETLVMLKCLAKEPGLRPPGGVSKAVAVARCESGFYDKAQSSSGTYQGIYQLGDAEFQAFSRQGPAWTKTEFNKNDWHRPAAVFNARANIMAALAHANSYGWGAWSCA